MTRTQTLVIAALALSIAATTACRRGDAAPSSDADLVTARRAADMIEAALAADRAVYTAEVIQRLTAVQRVQVVDPELGDARPLEAREDWRSEHGKLPLPAQMFRMGAERVLASGSGLSYLLLSPWPVNRQNRPRTAAEERHLAEIERSREPSYGTERLDGRTYFIAVYPDVATVEACVTCHNEHPDSPRRDFKVGDVMGGLVIRFPLDAEARATAGGRPAAGSP
jgi:hypothetical protein